MTTIDLAAAYREFGALMAEMGYGDRPYCITLDVWNYRREGQDAQVGVTLSAMLAGRCEQVYDKRSLDKAFAAMRRQLQTLKDAREGPASMALGLVVVPAPVAEASGGDDVPF